MLDARLIFFKKAGVNIEQSIEEQNLFSRERDIHLLEVVPRNCFAVFMVLSLSRVYFSTPDTMR